MTILLLLSNVPQRVSGSWCADTINHYRLIGGSMDIKTLKERLLTLDREAQDIFKEIGYEKKFEITKYESIVEPAGCKRA